jgi:hypothetical protein
MDAASVDAGFDFDDDLEFLDGLECFDLDLLDELGGDSLLAGTGKEGGLALDLGSPDGGRENSPDSVVTDDGAPSSGDREDGGEMSAYVGDLERFLMEDGADDEVGGPTTEEDKKVAGNEFFLNNFFVAEDGWAEPPVYAEEDLAANGCFLDDYLADDYLAEHHGLALPWEDAAVEDAVSAGAEEELATDDYFVDDFFIADGDGCNEPASGAGVVDPTPEEEGEDAGAREDEGTSRKRARYE